jgi:hypothetical protein
MRIKFKKQEAGTMKTRAECIKKYGSDYFIEKKIEEGKLFKVGKGIYSETKHVPEMAMFVYKYPNAVVTMKSAFFFYGLTDVIPDECDLATTRNAAKIKDERVKQYFVRDDFFEEGIENKKAKVLKPKQVLFEKDTTMEVAQNTGGKKYSVFGHGKLVGVYDEAGEAVRIAKKIAGVVISPEQKYVWEDGNRVAWYRNFEMGSFHVNGGESALAACIRAVLAYEGERVDVASELGDKTYLEVLDTYCGGEAVQLKDCSTADMRYLIDKGIPVIALTGNDSAVVLVGYDAKTVTYIDPASGSAKTRNFSAVDAMMSGSGNTFFAYVK